MRENMPVLVQGNAIDLVAEIDNTIDSESIKSAGSSVDHGKMLWIADDFPMSEATRKFVANFVAAGAESEQDKDDSAAA